MAGSARARVLIVDDDRVNRTLITRLLEMKKLDIATAESGRQALELLRQAQSQGQAFDLVLLDILMPGMGGESTLAAIKGDVQLSCTPVIVMSSTSKMRTLLGCMEAGAEDYLLKPVNAQLLTSRLNAVLLRSELERTEQTYQCLLDNLATAAAAATDGAPQPDTITSLIGRPDGVGRLARAIARLAAAAGPRHVPTRTGT